MLASNAGSSGSEEDWLSESEGMYGLGVNKLDLVVWPPQFNAEIMYLQYPLVGSHHSWWSGSVPVS